MDTTPSAKTRQVTLSLPPNFSAAAARRRRRARKRRATRLVTLFVAIVASLAIRRLCRSFEGDGELAAFLSEKIVGLACALLEVALLGGPLASRRPPSRVVANVDHHAQIHPMPRYALVVGGVTYDVDFPHEAYACQLAMMEKVIESLSCGKNALLESPTGASERPTREMWAPRARTSRSHHSPSNESNRINESPRSRCWWRASRGLRTDPRRTSRTWTE